MKLYETINAENWGKGAMYDKATKRRCVLGHANRAYANHGTVRLELDATARLLFPDRVTFGGSNAFADAARFNDHPDTTVEDVIRVCKVADV